jgi:hypothetical protein
MPPVAAAVVAVGSNILAMFGVAAYGVGALVVGCSREPRVLQRKAPDTCEERRQPCREG